MTHDYDEIDHAYEAEQAEELATFLSDINPDMGEPLTARDRAVWPEYDGVILDDPVDLHIRLERPVYEWMVKFLKAEEGNSFFCTFEEAISTMIRAMASGDSGLDDLKSMVAAADFNEKIRSTN
jgi:hypothetical protein